MGEHKETKKKLKGPDAFQVKMGHLFDLLLKNQKQVVIAVVCVLGVAFAGFGLMYLADQKVNDRREELATIDVQRQDELKKVEDQRKVLNDKVKELNKGVAATVKDGANKADEPKEVTELKSQIEALKADHSASDEKYKSFYQSHSDTPEGWAAGFAVVRSLLKNGNVEEAEKIVSSVVSKSASYPIFQITGNFLLIGILEDQKRYDDALKSIESFLAKVPEDLKPKLLLAKGRVLYLKKENDKAKDALGAVIEKHGKTPEADKARSLMGLLN